MGVLKLKNSLERLRDAIHKSEIYNLNLNEKVDLNKSIHDFKKRRLDSCKKDLISNFDSVKTNLGFLNEISDKSKINKINNIINKLGDYDLKEAKEKIDEVLDIINQLDIKTESKIFKKPKKLPKEISKEILDDVKELERCFNACCYKSVVVLCGRILEIALHRKYFELTNVDVLEKSPGIGLGKLVAKLVEKKVKFDPGLTQQIHLINQVRVSSVHKKKEVFYPSVDQAHAIVLYTLDILNKLF